jgi:hypothetical protein
MGSPDEPAHVVRAASVVRGEWIGSSTIEENGRRHDLARVPETLVWPEVPCFAQRDATTPACDVAPKGRGDVLVEVQSEAARYNPAYYVAAGLPTLVAPGRSSIYVMRLVTAALVAALLTLAAIAFREGAANLWGFVGLAFATTPMLLFLAGSVNPNAVEIAAGAALWATLLAWFGRPDPALHRGRAVRATLAAATLAASRPLSPLFLVLIVACALLVVPRGELRRVVRASRSAAFAVAAFTLACVGWTLSVGTLDTSEVAYPEFENVRRYVYTMILSLDDFNRQMIGVLGWLDTPLLSHAYDFWFGLFGFLVVAALAVGELRHRVLLLVLLALTVVVPIAVQWPAAPELGIVWQGRYLLPLAVGVPLVAGWVLSASPGWNDAMRSRWAAGIPLVCLAVFQLAAFWWALHRNVIGIDEAWIGFEPLWQPPLGWIALTAAYGVAVATWTVTLARLVEPRVESIVRETERRLRSVDAAA